ncbi:hypothetical protein SERLA73DRAFT_190200 [Serpula lacrymans var. lacrymans S7.3]|uniref:Gamma interferon inducible lysosomal thiol reductase n=2 Tax=Serpula lacrymans var. lacrymans TaxID=341189 RepID=F8QF91_SERL3|nr:uncharacterized protein SERLADRAFT_462086 [Serpula lacrymans var. lacrymans S7.9]EGN93050.1 hypothetical protein SERLA73DRAFT_190200 [Serpula lacrymans var. lacrymans S7.3]EGO27887.1 hypothetical protein SERLADRAFT_462086 [Serpula lacrymans var. lacrymans S7.9]
MFSSLQVLLGLFTAAWALSPPLVLQDSVHGQLNQLDDVKVPVVLGVMSRCPDAMLCESVFNRVLQRVGSKVDISLTFIAKPNTSEPVYGVTCMHGTEECAGNVQELCAAKYSSTSGWWDFLQCQNFQGREKIGTPETALSCAKAAGIEWENGPAGQCAGEDGQGEEGVRLLQESVQNTISMGITKSCTIMINNEKVCIRDGTWYECEGGHAPTDFIRQINEEYERLNSDD